MWVKWNQIIVCLSNTKFVLLPYPSHSALSHPWEVAAFIPWASTALVAIHAREVSAEGGPVSPGSANRISTPCAWENVFCLWCSVPLCLSIDQNSSSWPLIFSFFPFHSLWANEELSSCVNRVQKGASAFAVTSYSAPLWTFPSE